MSAPTTSIAFSQSTPAAQSGYALAIPQSDNGTPLQVVSQEYPNRGGAAIHTASYAPTTAQAVADCGLKLVFNSATAASYTLPATLPVVNDGGGTNRWMVEITNIGAGTVTLSVASGLTLDGSGSNTIALAQYTGVNISTDGTNYLSNRGASIGGITQLTGDMTAGPGSGSQAATVVATHLTAPLPVAQGGTGTASPGLVAGANVTISGAWPNQTVAATGGGGGGGTSGVMSSAGYSSSQRALGTIYQNTSSYPLIVTYGDTSTSPPIVAVTDSSPTPTSVVWSMVAFTGGGLSPCMFVVMPGHYYKITGQASSYWREWTFNTGTFTASGDLAGSRSLSTPYHNTGSGFMVVEVVISGTSSGSTVSVFSDSTTTPTTLVVEQTAGSTTASVFFMVPAGDYYKVTVSAGSIAHWNEYSSSIAAVKSSNLFALGQRAVSLASQSPFYMRSVLNNSGKTRFVSVVCTITATDTLNIYSDSVAIPLQPAWTCSTSGNAVRCGCAFHMPNEFLAVYADGTVPTISASTSWFEYTLG